MDNIASNNNNYSLSLNYLMNVDSVLETQTSDEEIIGLDFTKRVNDYMQFKFDSKFDFTENELREQNISLIFDDECSYINISLSEKKYKDSNELKTNKTLTLSYDLSYYNRKNDDTYLFQIK